MAALHARSFIVQEKSSLLPCTPTLRTPRPVDLECLQSCFAIANWNGACKQACLLRIGELAISEAREPFFFLSFLCTSTTLTAVAQSMTKRNDLGAEAFASASAHCSLLRYEITGQASHHVPR